MEIFKFYIGVFLLYLIFVCGFFEIVYFLVNVFDDFCEKLIYFFILFSNIYFL